MSILGETFASKLTTYMLLHGFGYKEYQEPRTTDCVLPTTLIIQYFLKEENYALTTVLELLIEGIADGYINVVAAPTEPKLDHLKWSVEEPEWIHLQNTRHQHEKAA